MLQPAGSCKNSSCNQFNDGDCNRFRLGAVRDHRDPYHSGDLDRAQPDLSAGISTMIDDHKAGNHRHHDNVCYLAKKKNPISHINVLPPPRVYKWYALYGL